MGLIPIMTPQMRQSLGKILNSYIPDWSKIELQGKQAIKEQKPFIKMPLDETDAFRSPAKGIDHDIWQIEDGICLQRHPTLIEKLIWFLLSILNLFLSPLRALQRKIDELIMSLAKKLGVIGSILALPFAIIHIIIDFFREYLVSVLKSITNPIALVFAILKLPFWILKAFISRVLLSLMAPLLAKVLDKIQQTQQALIAFLAKYGWLRGIILGIIRESNRPISPIVIHKKTVSELVLKKKWSLFGSKTFLLVVEGDRLKPGFGEYIFLRMKQIFFPYYWERTVHMMLLPKKEAEKVKSAIEDALRHDESVDEVVELQEESNSEMVAITPDIVVPSPAQPAGDVTTLINYCPKCNSSYNLAKKFCGKCGVPLVAGTTSPTEQDATPQATPDVNPPDIPLIVPKSDKTSAFAGIAIAVLIAVVGYFGYDYFIVKRGFIGKIDSALADGRYFAPLGDNVEEIYREQMAKSPDSGKLKEATNKIMVKFTQEGDAAFQRLYNDSDDTGWENVVKMYAFLNEIIPENTEIQALAAFSKAHGIMREKRSSDYSEALSLYQESLQLKPNWVFAINGIAKVYVREDSPCCNKGTALRWYNQACEADPNFPWAYTNIAAIYTENGQWNMAEQALLKALSIKNNRPSILIELGKVCEKQGKKYDARNYYQEALEYEKDPEKVNWLQKKIGNQSSQSSSDDNQQDGSGYYVIGMSTQNQQDAERESSRRNQEGFSTHVAFSSEWVNFSPGYYIVIYGVYGDIDTANSLAQELELKGINVYTKYSGNKRE